MHALTASINVHLLCKSNRCERSFAGSAGRDVHQNALRYKTYANISALIKAEHGHEIGTGAHQAPYMPSLFICLVTLPKLLE